MLEGPAQNPKQLQLHFNDKVICDFTNPGSKMGGKTPKFECKITRVESANGQVQLANDVALLAGGTQQERVGHLLVEFVFAFEYVLEE